MSGAAPRSIAIEHLVIAGWTGRDPAAVQAHIDELAALGVAPPRSIPTYYRVSTARLTQAGRIEVSGDESSGEVELVLIDDGELLVGLGSDHTDRAIERISVTVSKQMCDKPIARSLWRYEDVAPHWDRLRLRSFRWNDGAFEPYQDGTMQSVQAPDSLLLRPRRDGMWQRGTAMFCGTFAAHGGIRPAERFRIELQDPVRNRSIVHEYTTLTLPMD